VKDLNLLYAFEAIWRDRSVTAAAESLGLTQAAVSAALKRMREEYDDKLFTPVGRKMEPTPLAVELAPQLLDALSLVRKTHAERGRFDPGTAKRMFTIRTRDISEVVVLPRVLAALAELAPGIRLRTVFRPIPETVSAMASGQIDFALGFLPSLEAGIHRRFLQQQHYVCVMRAGHPLAQEKLTAKRFSESEHLLVEYSGSGHIQLERALLDAGARNRIRVRLPQYLSAPHFIATSELLWSVPAVLAETLAGHYPLVVRPHPLELPKIDVYLYWHDRYHRDPGNKWLRDFVAEQFSGS
jgi:DNA-binding transcriptional LysR family regulator